MACLGGSLGSRDQPACGPTGGRPHAAFLISPEGGIGGRRTGQEIYRAVGEEILPKIFNAASWRQIRAWLEVFPPVARRPPDIFLVSF